MAASYAVESTVVTHDSSTEFRNVVLEIDQVLALFVRDHIVEMDVLVTPFEVMYDALVRKFLLHYEQVLEKLNYPLVDIKVIKLSNHGLLILKILLVLVYQGISLVDNATDVIEHLSVSMLFQVRQSVV